MEKKKCKNCLYYEKAKGICQCADSDEVLDFTDKEFVCKWHELRIVDKTCLEIKK